MVKFQQLFYVSFFYIVYFTSVFQYINSLSSSSLWLLLIALHFVHRGPFFSLLLSTMAASDGRPTTDANSIEKHTMQWKGFSSKQNIKSEMKFKNICCQSPTLRLRREKNYYTVFNFQIKSIEWEIYIDFCLDKERNYIEKREKRITA